MSISNLLGSNGPNHYNIFVNSVYTEESFSIVPSAASQALSTTVPTQLLINSIVISPEFATGKLVLSPTSYTCPSTGVYHFGGSVGLVYVTTAADFVLQTVQIIANGATVKYQAVDQRTCAAGSTSSVTLPLNCYIFLTVGDVITVRTLAPISNIGAGNITTNNMTAVGTMLYASRG
jgi:hypothetical protein